MGIAAGPVPRAFTLGRGPTLVLCLSMERYHLIMSSAAQRIAALRAEIERHNRPLLRGCPADDFRPGFRPAAAANSLSLSTCTRKLATEDSPTRRVGGAPITGFRTVTHARPMLSIDNTYSRDELFAWHKRVLKGLGLATGGDGELLTPIENLSYVVEAESGRPGGQSSLRERPARAGSNARRWRARRRYHGECPHHPGHSVGPGCGR